MLANATVISLNGIEKELESDRQKDSALVANKLKKANETIRNLQAIIQSFKSHLTQDDDEESELKRQKNKIASLRAHLHAPPPASPFAASQSVASSLPPSSSFASIITPTSKKRTIGEIDESIVHNGNDVHQRLYCYFKKLIKFLISPFLENK
jgi:Sec-independent protein translocase protein TatA